MVIYLIAEAIIGIIGGILIAIFSKKSEGVVYNKLDKAGIITNILLIPVYACLSPLALGLGLFTYPEHDTGILAVLGWIVTIIVTSAMLFCGLGLGFSVALRKKGKSKKSFIVQFAGLLGIGLTVGLYCLFVGSLIAPLN
ncbi:MAG: hypothetical protein IKU42_00880 [Oscillospiraceae bacterium]|nr:hypothetical protein [Oscillospiraceae bacterium]